MRLSPAVFVAAVMACCLCSPAFAAFSFLEDFSTGAANWKQDSAGTTDLVFASTGGPSNDSYVTRDLTLGAYTPPSMFGPAATIVFRGQQNFNSSNAAFAGNWLSAGVTSVSAYVRHNASVPLAYTFRLADPANTPGASYLTTEVPSNVWTKLTVDVTSTSPQNLTYGGSTYNGVFDNIGNIQISAVIPVGWQGGVPITFDLDRVEVAVPEPASLAIIASSLAGLALVARRRR
jgi:hypothetical protein